jgi:hypothetical protein
MPFLVAEKCYFAIDHIATGLLKTPEPLDISRHHADSINKLATSIKKLKNRSTANECMEMFGYFLEYIREKDEKLAGDLLPHMEQYMETRKDININDRLTADIRTQGTCGKFPAAA